MRSGLPRRQERVGRRPARPREEPDELPEVQSRHLCAEEELAPNPAPRQLVELVDAILDQLAETGTGLLVTVDEVDPDLDEMVTLVTAYQHFFDENRKVALLMAGCVSSSASLVVDARPIKR